MEETKAYVLHSYPYKESSAIVHFFTQSQGHLTAVARGQKRGKSKSGLSAFVEYSIRLRGHSELLNLNEYQTLRHWFFSKNYHVQVSGLYLNELLMRLLPLGEAYPLLFADYEAVLRQLSEESIKVPKALEITLRRFEKKLLTALGYALALKQEKNKGPAIQPDKHYFFDPLTGLTQAPSALLNTFAGDSLLAFAEDALHTGQQLKDAKTLTRAALKVHLGSRPLQSRRLLGWVSLSKKNELGF